MPVTGQQIQQNSHHDDDTQVQPGPAHHAARPRRYRRAAAAAAGAVLTTATMLSVLSPLAASAATTHTSNTAAVQTSTVNCIAVPSSCGYPDATNTGVPAGTQLPTVPGDLTSGPGWTYDPRGWVQVTGNNAVLSGLDFTVNVNIVASNVTVENSVIQLSGQSSAGITLRHTAGATITHNTITGLNTGSGRMMVGVKDVYGDSTGMSVTYNNIEDTGTGIQMESGLIQGNYIHAMGYITGDHINGITSNGGNTSLLTISGNTVLNSLNQTDAISLFEDFGVQANRVITGNLLAGGGYSLYAGQNVGGTITSGIVVTNNRFSNVYFANGGYYGPVTNFNTTGSGDKWSGNVWDNSGATVPSS